MDYTPIANTFPNENRLVQVVFPSGIVSFVKYKKNKWYYGDTDAESSSIPVFWRYADGR